MSVNNDLTNLRYSIGQKLHFSCNSDFEFSVDAEIQGIITMDLAQAYRNIFLLIFNNDSSESTYNEVLEHTKYFYLCKIDEDTVSQYASEDGYIILCDDVIISENTYILDDSFGLHLNLSYNAYTSGYTDRNRFLADLETFLAAHNVNLVSRSYDLSDEEQNKITLANANSLINKLKELEDCAPIVNELKTIDGDAITNLFTNMINTQQTVIDKYVTLIENQTGTSMNP